MPSASHNDFDIKDWKTCEVDTDSLWIIASRDKSGKHKNIYHGNFIPQIAHQLILRYTKQNDVVLDAFLGSGTTLYECENLGRKCIGLDINSEILGVVRENMPSLFNNFALNVCDNTNSAQVDNAMQKSLQKLGAKSVQLVIFHPPYMDIVKFTQNPRDLSQFGDLDAFLEAFLQTCQNTLKFLDKNRYFAIVIGDVYKKSEVIPLGFYALDMIKRHFKVKLKGIIVKNIEGNRGKLKSQNIWRYRALKSDYYIFKHEYILVFKKEF